MNTAAVNAFIDDLHRAFHEDDANAAAKDAEAANVRRLQEQYRALARGDFPTFLSCFADDIEMEIIGPDDVPFVGRWSGKQQVAEAVRRNFALVEEQRPKVQTLVAQGDLLVLIAREQGRFRATGRAYDIHFVQVFTFRDGKVAQFRQIFDSAPLLDATRQPAGVVT
jgi:ketosteroid isomerase-like protein